MNSGTTLYEEAVALRAEVREVVAILENWNADRHRNHADRSWPKGGGGQCKRDNAGGTPAPNVTPPRRSCLVVSGWNDPCPKCGRRGPRTKTVVRSGGSRPRAAPPDPPLRPVPNPWYYLKIPKYVHLLNMSEQVRKVTNAHECNT